MMTPEPTPQDYIDALVRQRDELANQLANSMAAQAALQRGISELQEALAEVRAARKKTKPRGKDPK